jgi:pimeloyl-ACP methyl ester carboxylesterase
LRWYAHGLINSLTALRVPIYAINTDQGETDIEMVRKYAPSFKVRVIEGVGHVMMPEAPERFNTALREIMAEWTVSAIYQAN